MRECPGDDCRRPARQDLAETPAGFRLHRLRIACADSPLKGANHSFQYVPLGSSDDLKEALPPFIRYASRLLARLEKSRDALDRGTFFVRAQLNLPNTFPRHNSWNTPALLAAAALPSSKIETSAQRHGWSCDEHRSSQLPELSSGSAA